MKMIADGDADKAKDYRDKYVHKLGNLTITGYNSKLGNKSLEEKRDRKDSRGKQVGYQNGLFLNTELAKSKSWKIADIEKRTERLVEIAMQALCPGSKRKRFNRWPKSTSEICWTCQRR